MAWSAMIGLVCSSLAIVQTQRARALSTRRNLNQSVSQACAASIPQTGWFRAATPCNLLTGGELSTCGRVPLIDVQPHVGFACLLSSLLIGQQAVEPREHP